MQSSILIITLALMALVAGVFLFVVMSKNSAGTAAKHNKIRYQLISLLVIAGVIISVVSLRYGSHALASSDAVVINVVGGQWWWEIDRETVPLNKEVEFRITSEDVNHGMGIYNSDFQLIGQAQGMPGYTNKLVMVFDKPGTYQVLCLEFCGVAHHDMINEFEVVAAE
ncbi:MAG: hypothetical protein MI743_02815 [Sneathiellales bacterium]|nr:hypothetical protein [Sneathiellales bacterium]